MDRASAFFRPGGTLEPGAESYIVRRADRELIEALEGGHYVFLLDSRQKGKSSLVARSIEKLRQAGIRPVKLDLQRIGSNVTPEQWYAGLIVGVGQELGLQTELIDYWRSRQDVGPLARFIGALQEVVLALVQAPLVIFVDEVDFVRALDFSSDEFFAAIRECYNRRASDPLFNRLTFCLVGVATPGQLIRNPDISPFNIGIRIDLTDFTRDELSSYGNALDSGRDGTSLIDRIHHWVGGHPYLTQLLCSRVAADPNIKTSGDVDHLVQSLFLSPESRQREPNLSDVERRILNPDVPGMSLDERRVQVLALYGRMLKARSVETSEENPIVATLRLSGLGVEEGGALRVRNKVYRTVFDERWRQQNLPDAEVQRQRLTARAAILKTSSVAAVAIFIVSAAAYWMWTLANERQQALTQVQAQTTLLQRQSYTGLIASMNLALSEQRWVRISELVKHAQENPFRGWEWGHAAMYVSRSEADVINKPKAIGMFEPQPDGTLSYYCSVGLYDVMPTGLRLRQELSGPSVVPWFRRGDWRIGKGTSGEFVFQKVDEPTPRWTLKTRYRLFDADPESETILATLPGGNDAPFSLLSIRDGHPISEYLGPTFAIAGRFLPDGSLLSVHQAGKLCRRDRAGKVLANGKMGDVEMSGWGDIALTDDGAKFVFYDNRYRRVEVRRSSDLKLIAETQGPLRRAKACAFSRDGTKLAVGGWDGVVYLYDARSGALLDFFAGHRKPLTIVEFFGQDKHLASVDNGAQMLLWPLDSPSPVDTYKVHPQQAESAHLMGDGSSLLSSGGGWLGEKVLALRDQETGELIRVKNWRSYTLGRTAVYLSLNDGSVASLEPKTLKVVRKVKVFDKHIGEVYLVAGGTRLLVKRYRGEESRSSQYALLDTESLSVVTRFELTWPRGSDLTDDVKPSANGEAVAISAKIRDVDTSSVEVSGVIYLVSGLDGKVISKLQTERPFTTATITPDAKFVVAALHEVGAFEITPTLYDATTMREIGQLDKSPYFDRIEFGPNGRHLVGYKVDGHGFIWDFASRQRIAVVAPGTLIREVHFSPDGERVITSSANRDTKIWSTIHQDELMTLRYEPTRKEDQNGDLVTDSSKFSEDGTRVIMACTDGCVRIFNSIPWKDQPKTAAKKGP